MKIFCSAKQECFDAQTPATQQLTVYQRQKPYQMIGRWQCCPSCFEGVLAEMKPRFDLLAVIWDLRRKGQVLEKVM